MQILNPNINLAELAKQKKDEYQKADPFPNIAIHDFFDEDMLNKVVNEFPDLAVKKDVMKFTHHNEKNKFATKGEDLLGPVTKQLVHFLNSQPMLEFLQELSGIKEKLLGDPYLEGGGYHEIKPGGMLKLHADFNKHRDTNLDRRLNLLIYLNKDWDESYGGHFELWDKDRTKAYKKILPTFNTIAMFTTTDFSYHGHPDPLTCPPDRSRRSLALYYYTNGRPASEINKNLENHSTLYVGRQGVDNDIKKIIRVKSIIRDFVPPIVIKTFRKITE